MENRDPQDYIYAYESALNKCTRIIKWLIMVIVLLVLLLTGSNVAWIIYESQFEEVTTSEENEVSAIQIGEDNTVVGGDMNVNTNSYYEEQEND